MNKHAILPFLVAGALVSGCGGGGQAGVPTVSQGNLASNALQLAVGTANIAGTPGINFVTTYRQTNGLSAVGADTPSISGPSGFTVPAGVSGAYGPGNVDAGTNHITGSPQVNRATTPVNSTFGTFTGAFSYGFVPVNSDQTGTAYFIGNPNATAGNGFVLSAYEGLFNAAGDPTTPQPYYSTTPFDYVIGPPAVPFFRDGTFPGFVGYSPGFTVLQATPVAGTYNLQVVVIAVNAPSTTANASATLASTTLLGATTINAASLTKTAGGGISGTVNVPSGVTETEVFVVDVTANTYYTVIVSGTGAAVSWAIPGNLGPCSGANCQTGPNAKPTIATGDTYYVAAVGYNYPAFEAGPPGNNQQKPVITGANGQADLTMSPVIKPTAY